MNRALSLKQPLTTKLARLLLQLTGEWVKVAMGYLIALLRQPGKKKKNSTTVGSLLRQRLLAGPQSEHSNPCSRYIKIRAMYDGVKSFRLYIVSTLTSGTIITDRIKQMPQIREMSFL